MSINTRVRATSESVVVDVEIQDQRYRTRHIQEVTSQLDVPTSVTPVPSHLLRFYFMGCAKEVSDLISISARSGIWTPTDVAKKVCRRLADQVWSR